MKSISVERTLVKTSAGSFNIVSKCVGDYSLESPLKQFKHTLRLNPLQANPESFSTPWEYSALNTGLTAWA